MAPGGGRAHFGTILELLLRNEVLVDGDGRNKFKGSYGLIVWKYYHI